jgi:hypothetical protein
MAKQEGSPVDILASYADGPRQLEEEMQGISDADLDLSLSADSWSIRQIVHHLADGDDIWKACIKMALGNANGLFSLAWYWEKEQLEWSKSWNYAGRDIEPSLALLRTNRRHIIELIQPISETWGMSVRVYRPDGAEGRISIGEVIAMQAGHIVGHIQDIQAIRRSKNQ